LRRNGLRQRSCSILEQRHGDAGDGSIHRAAHGIQVSYDH
jgi:hypothetical protein